MWIFFGLKDFWMFAQVSLIYHWQNTFSCWEPYVVVAVVICLLHKPLTLLKRFQTLPLPSVAEEGETHMLTEVTPVDHSGSPQAWCWWSLFGHSLSFFLPIIRVPFFIGGLLKSPALPEGLSVGQRRNWSEMASHTLAALSEFSSLATLHAGGAGQQPCYFHRSPPMWLAPGKSAI